MNLTPASVELVRRAIRQELEQYVTGGLTGVSCIAEGADSIFAEVIVEMGCDLVVILPASDYRERRVKPHYADRFDALMQQAFEVQTMPFQQSNREAYEAANTALLTRSDFLFAVWDGKSAADRGGTAAVVQDAQAMGVPVKILWPDGAARD